MERTAPAIRLESPRIVIHKMRREDLELMQAWRPFRDPLHRLWHIPRRTPVSREIWFMLHGSDPTRMWFSIKLRRDARVIGALSLREIERPVSARLGIRLGADFVDRGYGSEALRLFLPYYFHTSDFERLFLDVAATNERAIHVYEKLGFQRIERHYRNVPSGDDLSFLDEEPYRKLRTYFRRHFGRMQLLFYDMLLERSDWEKQPSRQGA